MEERKTEENNGLPRSRGAPLFQPRPLPASASSWMSTPSRLKMREALAASTRHLESKDYDLAHAVCRQAAEHAADHIMTFGTEASSKNDVKAPPPSDTTVVAVAEEGQAGVARSGESFSTTSPRRRVMPRGVSSSASTPFKHLPPHEQARLASEAKEARKLEKAATKEAAAAAKGAVVAACEVITLVNPLDDDEAAAAASVSEASTNTEVTDPPVAVVAPTPPISRVRVFAIAVADLLLFLAAQALFIICFHFTGRALGNTVYITSNSTARARAKRFAGELWWNDISRSRLAL